MCMRLSQTQSLDKFQAVPSRLASDRNCIPGIHSTVLVRLVPMSYAQSITNTSSDSEGEFQAKNYFGALDEIHATHMSHQYFKGGRLSNHVANLGSVAGAAPLASDCGINFEAEVSLARERSRGYVRCLFVMARNLPSIDVPINIYYRLIKDFSNHYRLIRSAISCRC